ncbi:MAG: response regulator [Solirubrobacterales bacterium]|nr:response regulator [Solirubrobacterales bacterium]
MAEVATVLVVDDDGAYRAFLRASLEAAGFAVAEAEDGPAAHAEALRLRPEVVLLDWRMPGESGIVALRRLRAEPRLEGVRIAMVTGLDDPRDRDLARHAGADAFLVKTGDPDALTAQVRRLLAGGEARFDRRAPQRLL